MHSQLDQLGRQHLGGERERHHEYGEEHGEEGHPAAAGLRRDLPAPNPARELVQVVLLEELPGVRPVADVLESCVLSCLRPRA